MMKTNKPLVVVGIDYSMSCPAMTIHTGDIWSITNCKFYYLTNKKNSIISNEMITGESSDIDWSCREERFDYLASFFSSVIKKNSNVFIEAYSFGSKGQTFQIGENTGVVKHQIFSKHKIIPKSIAPSVVKKIATGKGNKVDKVDMCKAFVEDTKFKIHEIFSSKMGTSPSADIVDSYYVAKAGFDYLTNPQTKIIISL